MMKKFDLLKVGIVSNKVMAFFIYLTYALMSRVARPYQMHSCTRFCHKLSVHMLPIFSDQAEKLGGRKFLGIDICKSEQEERNIPYAS